MRFLVDMPLSPVLALWLTGKGHEATHASHRGLERADDATILRLAREEESVVLTADLDYPRLLAVTGSDAPGVLLFRGGDWGDEEILARLEQVLAIVTDDEMTHSILIVERHRIRRRRLPLSSPRESRGDGE